MLSRTTSVATSSHVSPPESDTRPPNGTGATTGERLRSLADRFAPVIAFLILIGVWEFCCWLFAIPTFLLPPPSLVVRSAFDLSGPVWLGHIWSTVRVALMGYAAAIVVSIPLAMLLASSSLLSRTLYPIIIVIHSTPIVAIAPIIVVTLGTTDAPRVFITFLITFFPLIVTTTTGVLATPEELIDLSRSLRAGRLREMLHIRLPFAIPYIFSALKICTTLSIIGAVVAEFVAAERGLGYFIQFTTTYFKISQAFAALAILVIISLTFFRLITVAQRLFVPWSLPKSER